MSRTKEQPLPPSTMDRDTAAFRASLAAGEARRLEYVATLDPRERELLDPQST